MNKVLFFVFLCASQFTWAQYTAKDVVTTDKMVWYGLDFSKAKMIGQFDQGNGIAPASGNDIKLKYIPGWNAVILNEPQKYDLNKTFRKTNVFKDLSPVEKNNSKIDPDNLFTYNDYKFENSNAVIEEIIKGYEKGEKAEGIGLTFIVEYFSKPAEQASVHVVFFDIATKKVLIKEHMYAKAGGIGLRNYWIRSIYNILDQIDDHYYKMWKNQYGK